MAAVTGREPISLKLSGAEPVQGEAWQLFNMSSSCARRGFILGLCRCGRALAQKNSLWLETRGRKDDAHHTGFGLKAARLFSPVDPHHGPACKGRLGATGEQGPSGQGLRIDPAGIASDGNHHGATCGLNLINLDCSQDRLVGIQGGIHGGCRHG